LRRSSFPLMLKSWFGTILFSKQQCFKNEITNPKMKMKKLLVSKLKKINTPRINQAEQISSMQRRHTLWHRTEFPLTLPTYTASNQELLFNARIQYPFPLPPSLSRRAEPRSSLKAAAAALSVVRRPVQALLLVGELSLHIILEMA
jgi:hypothetical protein